MLLRSKRARWKPALRLLLGLLMVILTYPPAAAGATVLISPESGGQGLWSAAPKTGPSPKVQARLTQCEGPAAQTSLPIAVASARVPILMYHHVRPIDFAASDRFTSDLTLPPAQLEQQLAYLRDNGFTSISLHDLEQHLRGCRDLPARSVVLTYDDGYTDNYLYAYPLLAKYGLTATFFIITGMVGVPDHMTWEQVKQLSTGGMEIGAHTVTHPDLAKLSQPRLDQELAASKKALEDALGITVDTMSYPSGSYSQTVVAAARKAGYLMAVTTKYGAVHRPDATLELLRVRIHGTDTLPVFKAVIQQQAGR